MAEFYVKVEAECNEFRIVNRNITKVKLTEAAENGRANAELFRELTEILGQKPAIVSGHHSRRKKLRVDLPKEKVEEKLKGF